MNLETLCLKIAKTEDGDDGTSASDRKNSTTVHGDLA